MIDTLGKKIRFDFIFIVIGLIISNFCLESGDIFYEGIWVFMCLLGGIWVVGSIIGFPFWPIEWTSSCIICGLVIAFTGAFFESNSPRRIADSERQNGTYDVTKDWATIGQYPQAKWCTTFYYTDDYGSRQSVEQESIGSEKTVQARLDIQIKRWNENHPKSQVIDSSKDLVSVPNDISARIWLKKHHYPLTFIEGR